MTHPTIHTYLVYCFACKQEYEQGRGKYEAEAQRPTVCGACGSPEIGTFKKIMPDPDVPGTVTYDADAYLMDCSCGNTTSTDGFVAVDEDTRQECEPDEHWGGRYMCQTCGATIVIPRPQTDWTVGRTGDNSFSITHHETLELAEARIVEIEKIDPAGVHAGDYFIDGPTE